MGERVDSVKSWVLYNTLRLGGNTQSIADIEPHTKIPLCGSRYHQGFWCSPRLVMLPEPRNMLLLEDFKYTRPFEGGFYEFTGREGLIFDGKSIPKFLWDSRYMSPYTGLGRYAAVIHDQMHLDARAISKDGSNAGLEAAMKLRALADELFGEMLIHSGVAVPKAHNMTLAVKAYSRTVNEKEARARS